MKKFLIFGTILFIVVTAFIDTKDLIFYLKNRTAYSKTPSQMEIRHPLNRKEVAPKTLNLQESTKNIHDKFRKENEKKEQDKGFYNFKDDKSLRR